MGIIFDIVLIAIIILNVFICYKKGLVKLAVGLIAVFLSIILAMIFYNPISNLIIENTDFDDNIKNVIIYNFTTDSEDLEDDDTNFTEYMQKYVDNAVNKTKNEIVIEAADVISIKIINICVILGIFIISRLVLILLTFVADIITELPIVKQFNEIGGVIYGAIKALLIIYVILAIMFCIVCMTGNTTISEAISSSFITKFFYNNNILLNILF